MTRFEVVSPEDVVVHTHGPLPHGSVSYAREKTIAVVHKCGRPVLHARVKLTALSDPALSRPAVAQANLDVNGRAVRAQAAAATMREAIDMLQARLREREARVVRHGEGRHHAASHHGHDRQAHERHGHDRRHADRHWFEVGPAEGRTIVRRKSFTLARETPADAAEEMEAMGYDHHLFIDAETGQDSVIERTGPAAYLVTHVIPPATGTRPPEPWITISEHPAPVLTEAEAVDRLELTGSRFVFFLDKTTGRGALLYRRFDGHYGLILPPA
ncbi:MAG: sigma 54 modulation/S30EA ribosomal C-terminal domain-containing protein [Frankia sp.]|nr:sigma 54 modulation/S30EA ribosomal C-terminal domain-containing protein [Frankia sp.]